MWSDTVAEVAPSSRPANDDPFTTGVLRSSSDEVVLWSHGGSSFVVGSPPLPSCQVAGYGPPDEGGTGSGTLFSIGGTVMK